MPLLASATCGESRSVARLWNATVEPSALIAAASDEPLAMAPEAARLRTDVVLATVSRTKTSVDNSAPDADPDSRSPAALLNATKWPSLLIDGSFDGPLP